MALETKMSLGNDCLQLRNAYFNQNLKNRKNKVNSNSKICRNHLNAVSSARHPGSAPAAPGLVPGGPVALQIH